LTYNVRLESIATVVGLVRMRSCHAFSYDDVIDVNIRVLAIFNERQNQVFILF